MKMRPTMRTGDLAPDDPDLGAPHSAGSAVDISYALTGIELRRRDAVDTLELEERSSRVGVALATLVGNVLSPRSRMLASRPLVKCHPRPRV
jgi:hypothetical protein